jgi:hypothetical protein
MRAESPMIESLPQARRRATSERSTSMRLPAGDPLLPEEALRGAAQWNGAHLPCFVAVHRCGPDVVVMGALRVDREGGVRVRVEAVRAENAPTGEIAVYVAGSSGVVACSDGSEVASRALGRLPRATLTSCDWDAVRRAEGHLLGVERLESCFERPRDVRLAVEGIDGLAWHAVVEEVRDGLLALAALGRAGVQASLSSRTPSMRTRAPSRATS